MALSDQEVQGLKSLLISSADDEWMIGHRGSEWLALAPSLEEDLALSSLSQDEMAHAQLFYDLVHAMGGATADDQVYARPPRDWYHAHLTSLPRGDWAEWVVRRYLYEIFDTARRQALSYVPYPPLTAALQKMAHEEAYHLVHARSCMRILALGGPAAQPHLIHALQQDWPLVPDLFEWSRGDNCWIDRIPELSPRSLRMHFELELRRDFVSWGIPWPGIVAAASPHARHHRDSEELGVLLSEMRQVRLIVPEADW